MSAGAAPGTAGAAPGAGGSIAGAGASGASAGTVLRVEDVEPAALTALLALLARWTIRLVRVPAGEPIPGSYWGDAEAGLRGDALYARADTPLHSVLHEACHYVCMDPARRAQLDRDAGGDDAEECAVCCLQILAAAELPGIGAQRLMADMDAWGYSFRLGSARAWFEGEAAEAREWLVLRQIVSPSGRLTGRVREC